MSLLPERIGVVPNCLPAVDPGPIRLAVIGESPGLEETHWCVCRHGHGFGLKHWQGGVQLTRDRCSACGSADWTFKPTPFVGPSGRLLDDLLKEAGLSRACAFVGNCARVTLSEHEKVVDNPAVTAGLSRLSVDLESFGPNCVLVLGGLALQAFHERGSAARITDYRGSLFEAASGSPLRGAKCVAGLHPAAVLREPSQLALLRFDIQRAVQEAATPGLSLPARTYSVHCSFGELTDRLAGLRDHASVACDIEGDVDTGVLVMGFATSPTEAFTVPFKRVNFSDVWEPEQRDLLWSLIRDVLVSPAVRKTFHNALYDLFVLAWLGHAKGVQPLSDTMLKWATLFPELEKALDVVSSILTKGEYWKHGLDSDNDHDRDCYCAEDCCRTYECDVAMEPLLSGPQRDYYNTQLALLEPVLDMMLRGIAFDAPAREDLRQQVQSEVYTLQGELDRLAGIAPPTYNEVAQAVAMKVKLSQCESWPDLLRFAKPSFRKPL